MVQFVNVDIERDRWGRPMILPANGGKRAGYRRTTTFIGALDDKSGLLGWKARTAASGMALRPDLVAAMSALDPDDKSGRGAIAEEAFEAAGGNHARDIGSAIHLFTERLDRGEVAGKCFTGDIATRREPGCGELVADSADHVEDLDAYVAATSHIRWLAIESFRVHDDWKIAGTADRIGVDETDGGVKVYDIKTGSIHAGAVSMQLGMYAHMVPYDIGTDVRSPLEDGIDQSTGIIIHLPAGQGVCELVEVDIAAGYGACNLAVQVWSWRSKGKNLTHKVSAPRVSTWEKSNAAAPAPSWMSCVEAAVTVAEVRKIWVEAANVSALTDELRAVCTARVKILDATTE